MVESEVNGALKTTLMLKDPTREDFMPAIADVEQELKEHSPLILAILQGLCLKTKRKNHFSPAMTMVYSISLYEHNQKCNLLQKAMGLTLWKTKAHEQVYSVHSMYNATLHGLSFMVNSQRIFFRLYF
jgi:hypothetical protein